MALPASRELVQYRQLKVPNIHMYARSLIELNIVLLHTIRVRHDGIAVAHAMMVRCDKILTRGLQHSCRLHLRS